MAAAQGQAVEDGYGYSKEFGVMLEVTESTKISCSVEVVRAQFGDVKHHERHCPHRGVSFRVLDDASDLCRYEQVSTVGVVNLRQQLVLDRSGHDGPVNTVFKGPLKGGTITFRISGDEAGSVVTATIRADPKGVERLMVPLLRRVLWRSLAKGLEEDRVDLESGRYPDPRALTGLTNRTSIDSVAGRR